MDNSIKKKGKYLFWGLGGMAFLLLLFLLADLCFPLKINIAYSQVVEARDGSVLHAYLTADDKWRMKTTLSEITPQLKKAVLFKEDKYFYKHFGINPFAVGRALVINLVSGRRTSGASTITMQVARLLDPKRRTYFNKGIEMFRALQLEWHYSKDEILQMYLNLVPYGSNIEGVKAASLLYFNKSPDQLSLAELTALSIIPNRPNERVIGKDNDRIVRERNRWLRRFEKSELFSETVIKDALQEPLTAYRRDAPEEAPHFSLRMRQRYPTMPVLATSLDVNMQSKAESIVSDYIAALELKNIHNAAVLVVDNRTHQVRAYVGSADFKNVHNDGQVDGVQALRSPGSTLKPLLYGLAFDKGFLTPKRMIADVPVDFQGYAPENYDQQFNGNVTVEYALENSLNIPAVEVLQQLGVNAFIQTLGRAGFEDIKRSRKELGLSLILGGCGVRLDEMTALYEALANKGRYYPLEWLQRKTPLKPGGNIVKPVKKHSAAMDDLEIPVIQLLSPSADFMVTDILTKLTRPDLPGGYESVKNIPRIAWKTGTSYGRRDAWSIGYNDDFTVGVWVGNFSGQGVPTLSGAIAATPLLFKIFNAIDNNVTRNWNQPPPGLSFRLVCAVSGKIPNDFCKDQVMDDYIPGVSDQSRCEHLEKVWVSANGKYSYCTVCLPASGYVTRYYLRITPALAAYNDANNISYKKIPPHNPRCSRVFTGQAPVITSLENGLQYLVEKKEQQQLMLSCTAANDVKTVYWYINDRFFSKATVGQKLFFVPTSPMIKISCSDDKGRNTDIRIKVKYM